MAAIESGNIGGTSLRNYQLQVLQKLKLIRESLVNEIGDVAKITEEHKVAVEENVNLKKEIEKLNYRIHILIKSLNEEEAKNARH